MVSNYVFALFLYHSNYKNLGDHGKEICACIVSVSFL